MTEIKFDKSSKFIFYGKEESVLVAGVAIVLMYCLHLFYHTEWYLENVSAQSHIGQIGDYITKFFSSAGGICVEIFAFTSGYALWLNRSKQSVKNRSKRLISFLIGYWIVFAAFLVIGFFNNDELPSLNDLSLNAFGIKVGPSQWVNVPFAWYVCYYIEFVLLSPFILKLFSSGKKIYDLLALTAIVFLMGLIQMPVFTKYPTISYPITHIWPILAGCIGLLVCKYGIFEKIEPRLKKTNIYVIMVSFILCIGAVSLLKKLFFYTGPEYYFMLILGNALIAMMLVALIVEFTKRISIAYVRRFILFLGTLSMYLWFWHGIFFTGKNFGQIQLYFIKEPLLILLLSFVITIPLAFASMKLHKAVSLKLFSLKRLSASEI